MPEPVAIQGNQSTSDCSQPRTSVHYPWQLPMKKFEVARATVHSSSSPDMAAASSVDRRHAVSSNQLTRRSSDPLDTFIIRGDSELARPLETGGLPSAMRVNNRQGRKSGPRQTSFSVDRDASADLRSGTRAVSRCLLDAISLSSRE